MRFTILMLLTVVLTGLLSSTSYGQAQSFTLKEAQDYAVQNNYNVKNAGLDVQIAEKKIWETMSIGFPQISGTVDYTYFISIPTVLVPGEFIGQPGEFIPIQFGTKNNATLGISLNQLVFDGRYFIGLQYSKIYKELSEKSLVKSEREVKEMVTTTYYNVLVGEEGIRILDSTLKVLEKTRYETEQMFKVGFVEETDYDQLTMNVSSVQNLYNSTKRQTEIGYQLLKYQMGIDLSKEIKLSNTLDEMIQQANVEAIANQPFVVDNNIDYQLVKDQELVKNSERL